MQPRPRLSISYSICMGKSDSVRTRIQFFQISYVCMHEHEPILKNCSYALKSPPQRREDVGLLNAMY